MRIFKWMKKGSYLIALLLVNMLLSFLLEPESGASKRMWAGYYEEEKLDTIFVGSSLCQQTFIPEVFDKNMGIKSYNMGTPSQALPQTRRAIEVALEEHDIKTVIFGMDFSSLKYEPLPEAELTFESARVRQKGGIAGVVETLSYIYSEDIKGTENSINFLFPWLYNYENFYPETMIKNAKQKMEVLKEEYFDGYIDKTDGLAKGYRNDDRSVFNYDNKWTKNTYLTYEAYFNAEMLAEFDELLAFCQKNELEFIVANLPNPSFDIVSCYEFYEENQKQLKEYCEQYAVDYYDFSLIKPEIFEIKEEYFCDNEHLNRQGSEVFSQWLSTFLNQRNNGKNLDSYFYSLEEYWNIHREELEEWKAYF